MGRTYDEIEAAVEAMIPQAYREAAPIMLAVAGPLYESETFAADELAPQILPSTATAPFLDLIAGGFGLFRAPGEDDDALRARIKYQPTKITLSALNTAIGSILTPLAVSWQLVEHWRVKLFCRATGEATIYRAELFADTDRILGEYHGITVVLPAGTDPGAIAAVAAALRSARAAGVSVYFIVEDGLTVPVPAYPWSTV